MSLELILVISLFVVAVIVVLIVLVAVGLPLGGGNRSRSSQISEQLRSLIVAQREEKKEGKAKYVDGQLAQLAAAEGDLDKKKISAAKMTLEKRLRYAGIPLSENYFRLLQVCVALFWLLLAWNIPPPELFYQSILLACLLPWLFMEWIVNRLMNRRVDAFDKDYPVMLMSYVSLLKTGMNTITGLEAASKGLDEDSLVRDEVGLLIERLRLGLSEDVAINSFADDIAHPELELFVQSLLLSRKVGGHLSSTLERLAKQVRKRQQFRKEAVAAVGMERGSILMVGLIMMGLVGFLSLKSPELMIGAVTNPTALMVVGWSVVVIVFGFLWSRAVTNIKI